MRHFITSMRRSPRYYIAVNLLILAYKIYPKGKGKEELRQSLQTVFKKENAWAKERMTKLKRVLKKLEEK